MSRIVVTGAAGFVGSHTVEKLIHEGFKVMALDSNKTGLLKLFKRHKLLDFSVADITDASFDHFIKAGDKILHLAAIAHFSQAEENVQKAIRTNVEGTLNVVKAAIKKKAERIVYSSTGSVYDVRNSQLPIDEHQPVNPENEYGITKKQAEDWVIMYGKQLPYVILRYPYIYGPRKDWGAIGAFFKRLKEGKRPIIFGGKQSNDFTYINDVVKANLLALETNYTNQIFNIGTGKMSSIQDVCEQCIAAVERAPGDSPSSLLHTATFLKRSPSSPSSIRPQIEPARTFDFPLFVYNISKAETILGFSPKWNIYSGISDMAKQLWDEGYFE